MRAIILGLAIVGYFALWGYGQQLQHDPATWPFQLVLAAFLLTVPIKMVIAAIKDTRRG